MQIYSGDKKNPTLGSSNVMVLILKGKFHQNILAVSPTIGVYQSYPPLEWASAVGLPVEKDQAD
ncbi:hypothetical protein AB4Z52_11740 [Rhizobium sp. 2YAF20]|uniref:hypothetical protein n=1 Tax=Rhizobium sp. 2YAF20 TaxID=3233027 RepID=UPI003F9A44CC